MIAKAQPFAFAECLMLVALLSVSVVLSAQTPPSEHRLLYSARGTGRTTGHVITLYLSNPGPVPMRTDIGDCLIPAAAYQGYVIPEVYPVEIAPFSTQRVELKGYCLNAERPALAEGTAAVAVSEWVTWAAAAPLPEPGKPLSAAFVPTLPTAESEGVLYFPGTEKPFPYLLDFQKHPREATRLLLYQVHAADIAFEQLRLQGKLPPGLRGRSVSTLKDDIIQQALWRYAAQLSGYIYSKPHIVTQLREEAEQQVNQTADQFSKATRQQLEQQTEDVWSTISLVGAEAKLVAVPDKKHSENLFKASPTGPAADPKQAIASILTNINAADPEAGNQLAPVLDYLGRTTTSPEHRETAENLRQAFIRDRLDRLKPVPETPLRDFLSVLYEIERHPVAILTPETQYQSLLKEATLALQSYLHNCAAAPQPSDPDYIAKWRKLRSWQSAPWYKSNLGDSDPLKILAVLPAATVGNLPFRPSDLALQGDSWKISFPPAPVASSKKIPLWIPLAGIPITGTVIYLLTRTDKESPPAAPVAVLDAITLSCGGQGELNLLANDSGSGITLSSAGGSAQVTIEMLDLQRVRITASGPGQFTAIYTIADKTGQMATGTILITVIDQSIPIITCPPSITLEGCGQAPPPTATGQANATDDCPAAPIISFTDEIGGMPCNVLITRLWTAVDQAGNQTSCTQQISIVDLTPPVFTVCPVPVTVNCGQQNDLSITGQPVLNDACTGPLVTVSFTDDLSQLMGCNGTIIRVFTATDPCGNTSVCQQEITVVGVPCDFFPVFTVDPAVCGNCNGIAQIAVNPPGNYAFVWSNGETAPSTSLLCPGNIDVTVTDLVNGCTEVFNTVIPEQPMLTLTVQQIIPPSSPSSEDGRISLLITPPSAQPPFQVFLNGAPWGLVNTAFFEITNMPAGQFEILVVDNGGQGCPSNIVVIVLSPEPQLPPMEISVPVASPAIYQDPETVEQAIKVQIPEHPAAETMQAHYAWAPAWGIAAGIPVAANYQLRLEVARQSGWFVASEPSGSSFHTPLQVDQFQLGVRKYSRQVSRWTFFQEITASRARLQMGNTWSEANQQWLPTTQQQGYWQSSIGGGLRRQLVRNISLEANLQLAIRWRDNARAPLWLPASQIRLQCAIPSPSTLK